MAPFLPIAVFLTVRLATRTQAGPIAPQAALRAVFLAAFTIFLPIWAYNLYEVRKYAPDFAREHVIAAEARTLFAQYPGAEMAYGRSMFDPFAYHRVQGGFGGGVQRFDVVNLADAIRWGTDRFRPAFHCRLQGSGLDRAAAQPAVRDPRL